MRLQAPPPETLDAHQRRVYEQIASGPRGGVRGPLAIWLHRPGLAEPAQALGRYCRYDSSLPPRLSELAILTMAVLWQSRYEWWAHEPHARRAGVASEVIETLRSGERPAFRQDDEAVVYDVVQALHAGRRLSDALYYRAESILGRDGLVDLVGLAGYYTLISMTLNVFEVEPPSEA